MNKEQIIDEVYENYKKDQNGIIGSDWTYRLSTPSGHDLFRLYTKEEFVEKCKKDPKFWSEWSLSEKWGLKIEERELSFEERWDLSEKYGYRKKGGEIPSETETFNGVNEREEFNSMMNDPVMGTNLPTKLITLTYNNETIEVYE